MKLYHYPDRLELTQLELKPRNWSLLVPKKGSSHGRTSKIILPYEPGYVGNQEADKQRQQTKEQLRKREREFAERNQPPFIVPERLKVFLP